MTETPLMQWLREEGEAKGKAEGRAEALLEVLAARGLVVTDSQRERILHCTDAALLQQWLRRAVSAASSEEVLA